MSIPEFDSKELKIVGEVPGRLPNMPPSPLYDFPVTPKEAFVATMERDPIWQITGIEAKTFLPLCVPDNVARAFTFESRKLPKESFGGKDMFGIDWVYVDVAGGSMVKPGNPLLKDANEWVDKLVWPDVDSWDWEGTAKANENYIDPNFFMSGCIMNGFYERLISFMDFDSAAIAMLDEDQKDAVKALFERLTDLYIKIIDKYSQYFNLDCMNVHDDWGSQRAPFFSPDTVMEMLVPPMKRLTDHIHSKGMYADFHCCGKNELLVPCMIAAGWDSWTPQPMNDMHYLYNNYGDKIIFGITPESIAPDTSEEAQRAAAAKFLDDFAKPGKPVTIRFYSTSGPMTNAYREELYKLSRMKFSA